MRPISFFDTLVMLKTSRNVRGTLHWRHAMKMQPAMTASWLLPRKMPASYVILNRCLAWSETVLVMLCASAMAVISLYAASRILFPLSCVDLFCMRLRSRAPLLPASKAMLVAS